MEVAQKDAVVAQKEGKMKWEGNQNGEEMDGKNKERREVCGLGLRTAVNDCMSASAERFPLVHEF